jgi:hypothetical protein
MRTNNLFRSVLALGAVLAVAGPGMVLAGNGPTYTPRIIQVLGPSSVPVTTSADYDAKVFFTDGTDATFEGAPEVTFTTVRGSISGDGLYTAPATAGRDSIKASYTNNGVTVTGSSIITN